MELLATIFPTYVSILVNILVFSELVNTNPGSLPSEQLPFSSTAASTNSISKANFGINFAKKLSLSTKFVKIGSYEQKKLIAIRPNDMTMNTKLFERDFMIKLKNTNDSINKICLDYL